MELEQIVLIEDDVDAQRLIVTWERAASTYENDEAAGIDRWARVANVAPDDVERLAPMLFDNGFIGTGGVVDPQATDWIRARLMVKRDGRRRERTPRTDDGDGGA